MELKSIKNVLKGNTMRFPEHREIARQLGADSMVLLKNNDILPINRGKVALFGAGAVDTIFCGNYSNYVFTDKNVSVKDGLLNAGFTFSTDVWLAKMEKELKRANREDKTLTRLDKTEGKTIHPSEVPISVADMAEAILGTDTCIYVIRRETKEYQDRSNEKDDLLLSEVESENIKLIASSFKKIIVVINSELIDIASLARMKNVRGIIYMGIPGMEAGNSLADILTGAVNPSAKLADTWAKKYKDYSTCSKKRSKSNKNEYDIDYNEGIFVGYRYFDTYDVTPLYPFGYGLSYTKFEMEATYFEATWMGLMMRIKVTNTGNVSGREVVQLYVSQPDGELVKPYQMLVSFAKTGKIKPGDSQEITIKIPLMCVASFDEEKSAWTMEAGEYLFRIGGDSRDTKVVAKMVLDKTTVIKKVAKVMVPQKEFKFMPTPEKVLTDTGYIMVASLSGDAYNSMNKEVTLKKEVTTYVPEGSNYESYVNVNPYDIPYRTKEKIEYIKPSQSTTFFDVVNGNESMEAFVSSLSPEILARIVCGTMEESIFETKPRVKTDMKLSKKKGHCAFRTTAQYESTLGIPSVTFIDGQSGMHIPGTPTTCFPAPMNMAQTWDMDAMIRMGRAYGREMEYYDIDYCLAPSLNIHRDPMWGKAYAAYSEDPTLAGCMGAGFVMGVKRYEGRNCVMKHLACYNQENNRLLANANVSVKAFAEIYLRAFSVCQYMAQPGGIMNSLNKINGKYASSQRGLNTDITRGDWGFDGFIMTEWGTKSDKAYDIHSGCDLIVPGYDPDKILEAMMNVPPIFGEDGYVTSVERGFYLGIPVIQYENWGSFILDKQGDEKIMVKVPPGKTLNDKIKELEKEGICKVSQDSDGMISIVYKGFNRGAFLTLGDLQHAVIHILSGIKDSAAMKRLMQEANL